MDPVKGFTGYYAHISLQKTQHHTLGSAWTLELFQESIGMTNMIISQEPEGIMLIADTLKRRPTRGNRSIYPHLTGEWDSHLCSELGRNVVELSRP